MTVQANEYKKISVQRGQKIYKNFLEESINNTDVTRFKHVQQV